MAMTNNFRIVVKVITNIRDARLYNRSSLSLETINMLIYVLLE